MSIDEFTSLEQVFTSSPVIDRALLQIANLAVDAFAVADGVGVTILGSDGGVHATVASARFVEDVDAVQFGLVEGPCFSAVGTGRIIHAGGLRRDPRWPRFGPVAARMGISSVMSLPLALDGRLLAAIDIYARRRNSINYRSIAVGRRFSVPAGIYLQSAINSD